MFLFLDTETTGVVLARDRIVQIAWVIADIRGEIIESKDFIIKPTGFLIPERASKIHGITTLKAQSEGHQLSKVLKILLADSNKVSAVIGHKISFDLGILKNEFAIENIKYPFATKEIICTMMTTVNHCRLQKLNGMSGYKRPTLQELHFHIFQHYFNNAHNAYADVIACMKCFYELLKRNVIYLNSNNQNDKTPTSDFQTLKIEIENLRSEACNLKSEILEKDQLIASLKSEIENYEMLSIFPMVKPLTNLALYESRKIKNAYLLGGAESEYINNKWDSDFVYLVRRVVGAGKKMSEQSKLESDLCVITSNDLDNFDEEAIDYIVKLVEKYFSVQLDLKVVSSINDSSVSLDKSTIKSESNISGNELNDDNNKIHHSSRKCPFCKGNILETTSICDSCGVGFPRD